MKCPKCKDEWKDGRCGDEKCPGSLEVSTWAENSGKEIRFEDMCMVNGLGDLYMDADVRPCIGLAVRVVGCTKGGLYRVRLPDGRTFSVAKRNLDKIETK